MPQDQAYDKEFFDRQSAGSLASARVILPEVLAMVPCRSLIDVGCGVGTWVRAAIDLGIERAIGVDGSYVAPSQRLIAADAFIECDLENGRLPDVTAASGRFDLASCLEVAEHLSPSRAASFTSELCQLADLVLFSAAVPGQGGTNHINEQWPSYWATLFAASGFVCYDVLRSRLWDREACEWWYLQNVLLFARSGSEASRLLAAIASPTASPMPILHPRYTAQKTLEYEAYVAELQQLLTYQPFGRDETIKILEARIDTIRSFAQEKEREREAALQDANRDRERHEAQRIELEARRAELEAQRAQLQRQTVDLKANLAAIENSTSWKLTRPLRALKTRMSGGR